MVNRSLSEHYRSALAQLRAFGVEFCDTEATLLCERFLSSCYKGNMRGRAALIAYGDNIPTGEESQEFYSAVSSREERPLQYILGKWEFMGMELFVGEGVLCPREDSAALVSAALEAIKDTENPKILDLCAGSGAIALGICSQRKDCTAVCVELFDGAFHYLEKNIEEFGDGRVAAMRADVLDFPSSAEKIGDVRFDLICSNPPYIPKKEIPSLSREVLCEPGTALDGGDDGLDFYRVICRDWKKLLKDGGSLCVEIGAGQELDVKEIYVRNLFDGIELFRDYSGKIRAINGTLRGRSATNFRNSIEI